MRQLPLVLIVIVGSAGAVICGLYALQDWAALQDAYHSFGQVARNSPSETALFAAEAAQNIHRINLFAEGVWALLSAILAAIGVHGLCVNTGRRGTPQNPIG